AARGRRNKTPFFIRKYYLQSVDFQFTDIRRLSFREARLELALHARIEFAQFLWRESIIERPLLDRMPDFLETGKGLPRDALRRRIGSDDIRIFRFKFGELVFE